MNWHCPRCKALMLSTCWQCGWTDKETHTCTFKVLVQPDYIRDLAEEDG